MIMKSKQFALLATAAMVAAFGVGHAQALTLNTSGLKSDAAFTLSLSASGSLKATGTEMYAAENSTTTNLPAVNVVDERGNARTVPSFNMPITSADVKIGLDLKISPNSGVSNGAALRITTPLGGDAVLANFKVDYKAKIVYADLIDVYLKTTEKAVPLYTFAEYKPQSMSLKGLVLNQRTYCGNLVFTPTSLSKLTDALLLDETLVNAIKNLDWGTIDTVVTSFKRSPALSGKPYTLADVPNQPQP
jgi:hypothetical protein